MSWSIDTKATAEYVIVYVSKHVVNDHVVVNVYAGPEGKGWSRYEADRNRRKAEREDEYNPLWKTESFVRKVHRATRES